jgi:hypothetical protein
VAGVRSCQVARRFVGREWAGWPCASQSRGGRAAWLDHGVTLLWFFVWLIWNLVGDEEPLTFDPVNWWAGLLLFAVAVDLSGVHAHGARR